MALYAQVLSTLHEAGDDRLPICGGLDKEIAQLAKALHHRFGILRSKARTDAQLVHLACIEARSRLGFDFWPAERLAQVSHLTSAAPECIPALIARSPTLLRS